MNEKSILIVDDDKLILQSLRAILEREGYRVDTAETGRDAIEKSKGQFFNLALLDFRLPDMKGTDLLTSMHETIPRMVKIMFTGYPSLENAVDSVNLKADFYFIKPVKHEELLNVIRKKLREQEEAEKMDEAKVASWIETRSQKLGFKPK